MPDEQAATLKHLYESDTYLANGYMRTLRHVGYTLQEIASVIGVSRERVRQRLQHRFSFVDLPPVPIRLQAPVEPPVLKKRIRLSEETIERLREMHQIARTINGGTRSNDPRRQVAEDFTATLAQLVGQGVTVYSIAKALGTQHNAINSRLARYGYRKPTPSTANQIYQGRATFESDTG